MQPPPNPQPQPQPQPLGMLQSPVTPYQLQSMRPIQTPTVQPWQLNQLALQAAIGGPNQMSPQLFGLQVIHQPQPTYMPPVTTAPPITFAASTTGSQVSQAMAARAHQPFVTPATVVPTSSPIGYQYQSTDLQQQLFMAMLHGQSSPNPSLLTTPVGASVPASFSSSVGVVGSVGPSFTPSLYQPIGPGGPVTTPTVSMSSPPTSSTFSPLYAALTGAINKFSGTIAPPGKPCEQLPISKQTLFQTIFFPQNQPTTSTSTSIVGEIDLNPNLIQSLVLVTATKTDDCSPSTAVGEPLIGNPQFLRDALLRQFVNMAIERDEHQDRPADSICSLIKLYQSYATYLTEVREWQSARQSTNSPDTIAQLNQQAIERVASWLRANPALPLPTQYPADSSTYSKLYEAVYGWDHMRYAPTDQLLNYYLKKYQAHERASLRRAEHELKFPSCTCVAILTTYDNATNKMSVKHYPYYPRVETIPAHFVGGAASVGTAQATTTTASPSTR